MLRTAHRLVVGLSLLGCGVCGAQTTAQDAADSSKPVSIVFGQAAVPLYGPWKFTVGDSPVDPKTGKPLWAEPDFDDSKWENVDLTPDKGDVDPYSGNGVVLGWTSRGHAGYSGYAWYRIRVRARSQTGQPLDLAAPDDVEDGYQFFADGELLGSFGDFSGKHPRVYYSPNALPPSRAFRCIERRACFRLSSLDGALYARRGRWPGGNTRCAGAG